MLIPNRERPTSVTRLCFNTNLFQHLREGVWF